MKLTVAQITEAVGGKLMGGSSDAVVSGVSTDSRTIKPGDLFVALIGPQHDGHAYLSEVFSKGAVAAIVSQASKSDFKNIILVPDTLKALGDLAHFWRKQFSIPVVAVTGSNGKTTVKDMIALVLGTRFRVLKTEGNLNNLIGLPQTLFRLTSEYDVAVLEMGMNHPGEIDRLGEIAEPSIGVITSIARAHLEGLGSVATVAKAKGELLDRVSSEGVAILNTDSSFFPSLQKRAKKNHLQVVGFGKMGQYRLLKSKGEDLKGIQFEANLSGERARFKMPCLGEHNARNALAALAVGRHLGVSIPQMKKALSQFQTSSKRMEVVPFPKKIFVINDCYNANPDSTEVSLRLLQQASRKRRRVAILGEMLELGPQASRYHREVGASAAKLGVNLLFAVGPHAEDMVLGARRQGLSKKSTFALDGTENSLSLISSLVRAGDLILVKGSRGMKMEKITEWLRGRIT